MKAVALTPTREPETRTIHAPSGTVYERQPKYLRIYETLRERITGRQWPAGSPLPSQQDLAAQFGVSIMTLRQALQMLNDEGLIETQHGRGTFVAHHYVYDLGHLRSFADDLTSQGAEITTEILDVGPVRPPADVAARLAAHGNVLRLRRLRLSTGLPVIAQTSYVPIELAEALHRDDLLQRGLYALLAARGHPIVGANETITPTTLNKGDARDLARPRGTLALLSHRTSFTATGSPAVDDYALLTGDSVAISTNRTPHHLEVTYTLKR